LAASAFQNFCTFSNSLIQNFSRSRVSRPSSCARVKKPFPGRPRLGPVGDLDPLHRRNLCRLHVGAGGCVPVGGARNRSLLLRPSVTFQGRCRRNRFERQVGNPVEPWAGGAPEDSCRLRGASLREWESILHRCQRKLYRNSPRPQAAPVRRRARPPALQAARGAVAT
jgi:hypothetical protein